MHKLDEIVFLSALAQARRMLVIYREEFSAVIRRHGLPGLLESLSARIGKLPATAPPATKC